MNKKLVHTLEQSPGEVKSAVRVLELFELLVGAQEPLGVSDIARALQMPKSSAHMLLASVAGRGYIVDEGERRYALHPSLRGEGRHWAGGFRGVLLRAARPQMRWLADETGESVFLGVLRPDAHLEYIEKVVSGHDLRVDAGLGEPRLLHATSTGLVLLTWAEEAVRMAYLAQASYRRLTPHTIGTAEELSAALTVVRASGYATVRDTNSAHAAGISVPLRDMTGKVVAALNLAAPTSRFEAGSFAAGLQALMQAALEISRAMGYAPAEPAPHPIDAEASP